MVTNNETIKLLKSRLDKIYSQLEKLYPENCTRLSEEEYEFNWYNRQQQLENNGDLSEENIICPIDLEIKELEKQRDNLEKQLTNLGGNIFEL